MQLELLNDQGQATSKVDAPDTVFARDYNEALVHQIVVAFQANARLGTRAQLDRAMVKHSTKKPWRQKGTGRARAGSIRSPLWGGGGVVFGPKPRDYSKKINDKVKSLAFSRALFDRAVAGGGPVYDVGVPGTGTTNAWAVCLSLLVLMGWVRLDPSR